jgi:hypothetical protein
MHHDTSKDKHGLNRAPESAIGSGKQLPAHRGFEMTGLKDAIWDFEVGWVSAEVFNHREQMKAGR